jgi:hypothetical protein
MPRKQLAEAEKAHVEKTKSYPKKVPPCHASSTRKKGAKLDVHLESICRHHARE